RTRECSFMICAAALGGLQGFQICPTGVSAFLDYPLHLPFDQGCLGTFSYNNECLGLLSITEEIGV
nr:hypothetical protein [Tanacetum cinerariifolium]